MLNTIDFTLENNFKVIANQNKTQPIINLQLYIKTGSCNENSSNRGFSHLTEHLVFKSTSKYPMNGVMEKAANIGGNINAFTEYDTTCFYIYLPADKLEEGIELLSELAIKANFSDEEFKMEKKVVLEEIKQYQNDPEDFFVESIPQKYFKNSPLKHPIIGYENLLINAAPQQLRDFYQYYYCPGNSFFVVSGDFKENNLRQLVEKYFGGWKDKNVKPNKVDDSYYPTKNYDFIQRNVANDMIAFAIPELSERDIESFQLSIVTKHFAVGKDSVLYKKLFYQEKLIDSIHVHSVSGVNNGITIILIIPKIKADRYRIIDIFLKEFDKLQRLKISESELKFHKNDLLVSHKYSFEFNENIAMNLASEEMLEDYKNLERYPNIIRNISMQDVDNVINKYLNYKYLTIYYFGKKNLDEHKIESFFKDKDKQKISTEFNKNFVHTKLNKNVHLSLKKIKSEIVGISVYFKVSHFHEKLNERGLNNLTSTLFLYGTEKKTHNELLRFCVSNGIQINVDHRTEMTGIKIKCFKSNFQEALTLLFEIITLPVFPEDQIETIKNTYINQLDRLKDYPQSYAGNLWKKMYFGRKNNIVSRMGTKNSLRKINRDKVKNWYNKYYKNTEMYFGIVGDIDPNYGISLMNELYDFSKTHHIIKTPEINIQHSKSHLLRLVKNNDQSIINIGGKAPTIHEINDAVAFNSLAQIIGGDINSRLFTKLREEDGVAYSVGFDQNNYDKFGFFICSAIVDKNETKYSLKSIKTIFNDIKKDGVQEKELNIVKNFIRGSRMIDEESILIQSQILAMIYAIGFDYDYYCKRNERLMNLTIDDLQRVAKKYFVESEYYTYILS